MFRRLDFNRMRDALLSCGGLAALSPVFLLIAVLVKCDSPGPVFFKQERVGLRGKEFTIFKFRSMYAESSGLLVTATGDARVSRVGRILRATKLDELPQLVNVLLGEMALVGPRPEVKKYVDMWPQDAREMILSVRPGITDPATVALRSESELLAHVDDPEEFYVHTLMPRKLEAYMAYVGERSFLGDVRVLVNTFIVVVAPSTSVPNEQGNGVLE